MAQVKTAAEAERLNETGEYGPYHAANTHTMIAPVQYPLHDEPKGPYDTRLYRVGDEIKYLSFSAWCADNCMACREGDPLPDW